MTTLKIYKPRLSNDDLKLQQDEAKTLLADIQISVSTLFTSQNDMRTHLKNFYISQVQHAEVSFRTILDDKACSCPDDLNNERQVTVLCPVFRYMEQLGVYVDSKWKKNLFAYPNALLTRAFNSWFPDAEPHQQEQWKTECSKVQRSLTRPQSILDRMVRRHTIPNRDILLAAINRHNNILAQQEAERAGFTCL